MFSDKKEVSALEFALTGYSQQKVDIVTEHLSKSKARRIQGWLNLIGDLLAETNSVSAPASLKMTVMKSIAKENHSERMAQRLTKDDITCIKRREGLS